ncbi:MAG: serine/threonine protein kinase [Burkholderiales bacterium]
MGSHAEQALPEGYKLLGYRITKQLGGGGFSLVYLAHDADDTPVAVKEYLPISLVRRDGDHVVATSEENLITFRYGMKCFFEEGRALASINHLNVVRVVNFFRANDTVYMVMQYERGKTLREYIQARKRIIQENFIRRVFAELLNGLREVHAQKLLHLDVKPANIYIRLEGTPVLLDFGAARQTLSNEKSPLSPMYTPGFAAIEQYKNWSPLGPWTDIYGIGATMYSCLAGYAPQPADARLKADKLIPAASQWHKHVSIQLLNTIDWCLNLDYMKRPQSVFALQKALMEAPHEPKKKVSLLTSLRNKLMGAG